MLGTQTPANITQATEQAQESGAMTIDPGAWELMRADAKVAVPLLLCFVFVAFILVRGIMPLLRDGLAEMKAARQEQAQAIARLTQQVHDLATAARADMALFTTRISALEAHHSDVRVALGETKERLNLLERKVSQ
jgi:hypothetical protein